MDIFKQFGEEIVKWNRGNLPDNTLWMQEDKIKEELYEFWEAKDTDIEERIYEEAADIIISIIGIYRFGYIEFKRWENYMFMICLSLRTSKLKQAIRKKLDILKTRKYEIGGGR